MPNAWDAGSARLFASMEFKALATTSGGHAATLGRLDGEVTRDEALSHAAEIVSATPLPVSADFEDCFADDPAGVAETVRLASEVGLAGCSIEDYTRREEDPFYSTEAAAERVAAAAEAARAGSRPFVLTARSENFVRGRYDIADTIARLQAFQEAGADVLYAPWVSRMEDIRAIIDSVDRPVNVLARTGVPPIPELAGAGAARISVGAAFAFAALGAAAEAARELLEQGTYGWWEHTAVGAKAAQSAFRE
jgi:2-methylisocitrate lyase-like PEP mutase family enzyme